MRPTGMASVLSMPTLEPGQQGGDRVPTRGDYRRQRSAHWPYRVKYTANDDTGSARFNRYPDLHGGPTE